MCWDMKNKKQIAALVGCILGGIVVGIITVAHYLGKTEGKIFPMFIFTMAFGTLIAGTIKYLIDKRRGINATTSKLTLTVILCVIVGLLIGAGISYHYFQQQKTEAIVREAVELVAQSGKISYKCPLKVSESDFTIEGGKVKEVSLVLICGDKIINAKVDWQSKNVTIIEAEKEAQSEITLISLYDNYRVNPKLETAWGFATLIKTPKEQILFDTGGSAEILLSNMKKLNINPSSIKKIVISHIHGDHVGGLEGFLEENNDVVVFIPRSFSQSIKNMIIQKGARFEEVSASKKISNHVYTTGELYGPPKEQSLIIDSKKGLVVITGCAHPGIVDIVEQTKKIMKKEKIYLVLGGFHNPPISCVEKFKELKVEKVAPSHCTGDFVREAFRKEYKENFIEYGVGKIIEIK